MDYETASNWLFQTIDQLFKQMTAPEFFVQLGFILIAVVTALTLALLLRRRSELLRKPPSSGPLLQLRKFIYQSNELLFPFLNIIALTISAELSDLVAHQSWLVRIAESVAVIFLIYSVLTRFIKSPMIRTLIKWIVIPIALLQIFGWLDDVTVYLDSLKVEIGNIKFSAYGIARVAIFGLFLFWIGRVSSMTGQKIIRSQQEFDAGTRELFAKLLQVGIFFVIFLLLLQIMGINLTTLAVFGGALGVGLGFGLQSIASNFISGIIILMDRSLTVGDYVELEDGHVGTIREMNMRSTTLETFDGKDVMVPNERFITTQFINWTHKNKKQRYDITFTVAYDTDIRELLNLVRNVVASHPQVLSGADYAIEEQPDAEIKAFGDSGIVILVEFWMEDIDDGKNRVGADLLLMIWELLRENGIDIPYPQREVRILNSGLPLTP